MRLESALLVAAAAAVIMTGAALAGCNGYSAPTTPYGGGNTTGSGGGNAAFDSGELRAPATFVHQFTAAGVVGYHCRFHSSMGMVGTVTVVSGAADSAVVTASGIRFTPAGVSIRPGGSVRWNVADDRHTITSD